MLTGYRLDGRGIRFTPGKDKTFFLFSTTSRPVLDPTHPPIQWIPGDLSPEIKRQGREADRLPASNAEVKNGGVVPPLSDIF
jgi:hypothetical protein